MGAIADTQAGNVDAAVCQVIHFLQQGEGVDHHAVANDV